MDNKRVYTVSEIQEILEIGRSAAYELIKKNLFRCVHVGGHIRVSKKSFDNWMNNAV